MVIFVSKFSLNSFSALLCLFSLWPLLEWPLWTYSQPKWNLLKRERKRNWGKEVDKKKENIYLTFFMNLFTFLMSLTVKLCDKNKKEVWYWLFMKINLLSIQILCYHELSVWRELWVSYLFSAEFSTGKHRIEAESITLLTAGSLKLLS